MPLIISYNQIFFKMCLSTFILKQSWESIMKSYINTAQTNYATTHHHPTPAKISLPPPITSQNISTTTHLQPLPAKMYPPQFTITHRQPKLFYKKSIYKNLQPLPDGNVKNLNNRPAIAKKRFFTWLSSLFLLHIPQMIQKSCSVNERLYYAKPVQF